MSLDGANGHLDLLLLGVLGRSSCHGYEVITALREQSGGLLDLTEGSVYPALHRLEDLGLLSSEWHPVAGRRRRVYSLTDDGRAALRAERSNWRALVTAVESVLTPGSRRTRGRTATRPGRANGRRRAETLGHTSE